MQYYRNYRATVPPEELAQCTAESQLAFWDDVAAGILADHKFYPNLIRCEGHLERGFYKAMHELDRLKAQRKGEGEGNDECRMPNAESMPNDECPRLRSRLRQNFPRLPWMGTWSEPVSRPLALRFGPVSPEVCRARRWPPDPH